MLKLTCDCCEFETYTLTQWRSITIASIHQSRNEGHLVTITSVPFDMDLKGAHSS